MPSRTVVLQGEPGSGKSIMACLTAVRKPVHVVDIDRKIASAGWAIRALSEGELTYWELAEPYDEVNLRSRLRALIDNAKAAIAPKGWGACAEYIYRLPETDEGKAAGTWVFDSLTLWNEHFKSHISYLAGHSKFQWDNWNALKMGWISTLSYLRDIARENDKDLILTVHERQGEVPGEKTTGVEYVAMKEGRQRIVKGTQDLKIWASIDGAFGQLIGSSCDEYYWLHVDVDDNGKPSWRCRVHPDGRRALRTSFILPEDEYEPDFRKIWK